MSFINDPNPSWIDVALHRAARQGKFARLNYFTYTWDWAIGTEGEQGTGTNGTDISSSWFPTIAGSTPSPYYKQRLGTTTGGPIPSIGGINYSGGGTRYTNGSTAGSTLRLQSGVGRSTGGAYGGGGFGTGTFGAFLNMPTTKKWGCIAKCRFPSASATGCLYVVGGANSTTANWWGIGISPGVNATKWVGLVNGAQVTASPTNFNAGSLTWHQMEMFQDQSNWYTSVDRETYQSSAFVSPGATSYPYFEVYNGPSVAGPRSLDMHTLVYFWEMD